MAKYQNKKEQYIPTASVIEEEKSDVIESTSEFSNKKKRKNNKYIFENYFLNKDLFLFKKYIKLKIKKILKKKKKTKKIIKKNKKNTG